MYKNMFTLNYFSVCSLRTSRSQAEASWFGLGWWRGALGSFQSLGTFQFIPILVHFFADCHCASAILFELMYSNDAILSMVEWPGRSILRDSLTLRASSGVSVSKSVKTTLVRHREHANSSKRCILLTASSVVLCTPCYLHDVLELQSISETPSLAGAVLRHSLVGPNCSTLLQRNN